jgi:hypothetical protein
MDLTAKKKFCYFLSMRIKKKPKEIRLCKGCRSYVCRCAKEKAA